jgi:CDGSH-type Zn-finger protein
MMTDPVVAQKAPYVVDEEAGKKWWCACGRSAGQPYCDGSHKGTGITPVAVEIEAPRKVAYCGCKHTGTPPFCDGAHRNLP